MVGVVSCQSLGEARSVPRARHHAIPRRKAAQPSAFTARQMRKTQTGLVYHYSFFMLIAVAAIGAYAIWSGGGFQ